MFFIAAILLFLVSIIVWQILVSPSSNSLYTVLCVPLMTVYFSFALYFQKHEDMLFPRGEVCEAYDKFRR